MHTWEKIQNRLSKSLDTFVTSHDITAFGLTSRPKTYSKYSLENSAELGLKVLKNELKDQIKKTELTGIQLNCERKDNGMCVEGLRPRSPDCANKYILMGHSMGCVCAVNAVIRNPKNIYGLILVAPALPISKLNNQNNKTKNILIRIINTIVTMIKIIFHVIIIGLVWLLQPILAYNLRIRIRKRSFWQNGLLFAYFKKECVQNVIDFYM